MEFEQWKGFEKGEWARKIDVRRFIQKNYTPYEGNDSFLASPTERTQKLWDKVLKLYEEERANGGIYVFGTAYDAGYITRKI